MALKRILDFSGITSNYISENSSFSFLKLLRGGLAGNEVEMMFFPQIISLFFGNGRRKMGRHTFRSYPFLGGFSELGLHLRRIAK